VSQTIEVKVLGSWEVCAGQTRVPVPPGHLRSLLSSLLLSVGQPVRIDTLAEQLWGGRQPANVRGTLSTYVTRLRRLLGSDVILSYPGGGYSLYVNEDGVDLHRFRSLLRRSRDVGSADSELVLLHQALGLWRGRPFTGVESGWLERDVVPALTEEWFTATERRIDLDLAQGWSGELIAELWQLTNRYSFRESLWFRLITTLHRSGRRADALAAYQQVRTILRDDLGIDPGEDLQKLHQAVLRDGPATENTQVRTQIVAGPHQLPHDNAKFVGREHDLAALDKLVANVDSAGADGTASQPTIIVAIDGAPGTGKTTLAVHWAHQVMHRYADVQLYLNLRGYSAGEPIRPAAAMEALLRSLDVPTERIPAEVEERSALLRSTLAGRRTLVLLDNARDAAQVRALLPGAGSLVIVTSRNQLRALSIRDGAQRLTLQRLSTCEAIELLGAAAGPERVAAEPQAAEQLADLCDRLPLALAIVAERAQRADTLSQVVQALTNEMAGLDDFGSGTDDDLHAALSWSYRTLEPRAAAVFRKLGLHPANDISLDAAAVLADLPVAQTKQALDQLVDAHMVDQLRANRYELHDLIRLYATEEARRHESDDDSEAAIRRVLDWYLHAVVSAESVLQSNRRFEFVAPFTPSVPPPRFTDQAQVFAWLEQEFECLRSVVRWAGSNGWGGHAWRIVIAMTTFLDRRIAWREGVEVLETALHAARAMNDRVGEGYALNSMGCLQLDKEEAGAARDNLEQALDCFTDMGHRHGEMMALGNLSMALSELGEPVHAQQVAEKAIHIARTLGYRRGIANNLNNMALAYSAMDAHESAVDCFLQADLLFEEMGDNETKAFNLYGLGCSYAAMRQYAKAIRAQRRSVAAFEVVGSRRWQAVVMQDLGNTLSAAGHREFARGAWTAALGVMRELGDPRAQKLERSLAE
jgi:DNA-binding SARP family transcriptional activator/tetratricopeptide (TPR) repeat protein